MRSLMSNITMVLMAALMLPMMTGELRPAKNKWHVDEEVAAGFCTLTYDQIDTGDHVCS